MLTRRYDDAFLLAHTLHRAQQRKGSEIPYIAHLMSVSALVIENGGDEDQAIAGLLHDAAEDCGGAPTLAGIEQRFGAGVAAIVADCTDAWETPKPAWRARKEAYLSALPGKADRSLLVSLADKVHNAESILADHRAIGEALWTRFTGGREGTRWYYRALTDVFAKRLPGALTERLARATTGFGG
ncbi:MAG: HD domain-containing protein [Methylobacteriaceae bacterium]|nr:HD domain-containing protein [Methylobacteriaceae bacterium]